MSSIEINGRVVDAQTGRPLGSGPSKFKPGPSASSASIDGVFRGGATLSTQVKTHIAPSVKQSSPRTIKHIKKHALQKSKTLVRHTLEKPLSRQSAVNHHTGIMDAISPSNALSTKADISRIKRAEHVRQHKLISKFSNTPVSLFVKKAGHLPVVHPHKTTEKPHSLSVPLSADENAPEDPFSAQIDQATSHQAQKVKLPKGREKWAKKFGFSSRAMNLASVSLAAAALIGFFAYQNVPNISLYLKAKSANVAADMPGYRPSGFSVGQIESSPGQIVINFRSNTNDDRNFQITQRNSDWNSEALLANYIDPNYRGAYQVRQDHGKTIYIYQVSDNSNATWVDGGIWYNIESRANLNQDQLNQIALSL